MNRLEDGDRLGHKLISAGLAPKDYERDLLEARRRHLLDSLTPAATPTERETMFRVVSALLGGFPAYGATKEQATATVQMVCRALDDVPVWAVQKAASNFIKGPPKIPWNPEKAPTPPQIRAEAKLAVLDVETELYRLSQVLDAELVNNTTTQDERDAALAHWAQLRAGIASTNVLNERTDDEVNRERSEMQRANQRVKAREAAIKSKSTEESAA